jgi:lipoprotein-anchoring transpeptidase ErfK/SrfK
VTRSHRRASRVLVTVVMLVVGVGTVLALLRRISRDPAQNQPQPLMMLDGDAAAARVETSAAPDVSQPQPAPPQPVAGGREASAAPSVASPPVPPAASVASVTWTAGPPPAPVAPVPLAVTSHSPIADAKARLEAGELLAARTMLNSALAAGGLGADDAAAARKMLGQISDSVLFSPRVFEGDPHTLSHTVQYGEVLQRIAASYSVPWELLARINRIGDPRRMRAGQTIKIVRGPFHAVVSKREFRLDVYLGAPRTPGAVLVKSFPVGLGKDDSTPAGTWLVEPHKKLRNPTYYSPRGEGIIASGDPKNPLGGYWIGLTGVSGQAVGKLSYGLHGTIEPETIGRQESMGCIRLLNEDVALLFDLLAEGKSTVIVVD